MDAVKLEEYRNGKYMTVKEYYSTNLDVFIELVEGRVFDMVSPNRMHQTLAGHIYRKIADYIDSNHGDCKVYPAPFDVQLWADKDTVVVPDISVICDPDKLDDHGCVGAPDLIIEIVSPGNFRHDYIRKLNLYLDAGVREYWIVDPMKKEIFVYILETDAYDLQAYTFDDTVPFYIYPGLSIDFSKIDLS